MPSTNIASTVTEWFDDGESDEDAIDRPRVFDLSPETSDVELQAGGDEEMSGDENEGLFRTAFGMDHFANLIIFSFLPYFCRH